MGLINYIKMVDPKKHNLHVVTEQELSELKCVLLEMLTDLADFCQEHDIDWCLCGGSAIGAVRHKGFIPWDDDMDIFMTRDGFEKFYALFPKDSEKYHIECSGDSGNILPFPVFYKKNTTIQTIQSAPDQILNLGIDIFILENAPDNRLLRLVHGCLCSGLLFIGSAMRMAKCKDILFKYGNDALKREVQKRFLFAKFFYFFSLEKWLKISDRVFSCCKNSNSKYVVVPSGAAHYFGEIYLREKITSLVLADFENKKFYIPKDPDHYLRIRYGADYMTIPPKEKQESHPFVQFDLHSGSN